MNCEHHDYTMVEDYIRGLQWSPDATDHEKSLVAGNIRGFYEHARNAATFTDPNAGYKTAYWEIVDALGIGTIALSPAQGHVSVVMPKLRAALQAAYGQQCAASRPTVTDADVERAMDATVPGAEPWKVVNFVGMVEKSCRPVIRAALESYAATRPAEVGGVAGLVAEIQQAVNRITPPERVTEMRQEYWKAGARAAIYAVSEVLEKYRTPAPGSEVRP